MNNIFQYKKLINKTNFKYLIASNPNTSIHTLDKLSEDGNYDVREYVAENPNTSIKTLDLLSRDEKVWIRRCVAQNPNTSIKTLDKLSRDYYIRAYVASNPTWIKYMESNK